MTELMPTRLRIVREWQNMSAIELSRRARVTPSLICWIEHGRYNPSPVQLKRIADALKYEGDPDELLEPAPILKMADAMKSPYDSFFGDNAEGAAFENLPQCLNPDSPDFVRTVSDLFKLAGMD